MLGEIKMESTRFGTFEPVCKARKDILLSELLSNAVQRINGEIPELDNGVDEISDEQELSVPADPNVCLLYTSGFVGYKNRKKKKED